MYAIMRKNRNLRNMNREQCTTEKVKNSKMGLNDDAFVVDVCHFCFLLFLPIVSALNSHCIIVFVSLLPL